MVMRTLALAFLLLLTTGTIRAQEDVYTGTQYEYLTLIYTPATADIQPLTADLETSAQMLAELQSLDTPPIEYQGVLYDTALSLPIALDYVGSLGWRLVSTLSTATQWTLFFVREAM
jgi:hypothetical protein